MAERNKAATKMADNACIIMYQLLALVYILLLKDQLNTYSEFHFLFPSSSVGYHVVMDVVSSCQTGAMWVNCREVCGGL
jgi:hypothetical protein